MGFLFSKKEKPPKGPQPSERERAEYEMKVTMTRIEKFCKKVEKERDSLHDRARALIMANRRDDALRVLRVKQLKIKQLEQARGQQLRLQELAASIESAVQMAEVVRGLREGKAALEMMHNEMPIESIEELLDESDAALEYQNEIDEMLGSRLDNSADQQAEEELDALLAAGEEEEGVGEGEAVGEGAGTGLRVQDLPAVPTHIPAAAAPAPRRAEEEAGRRERVALPA